MADKICRIWEWEWIFGHAVKAISSLGICSPWIPIFKFWNDYCYIIFAYISCFYYFVLYFVFLYYQVFGFTLNSHMMFTFGKVPLELETFHLWLNGGFLAHQHSAVYKSYFNVQRGPRIRRVLGLEKLRNKDISVLEPVILPSLIRCFGNQILLEFWESKFKFDTALYIKRVV